jgi:hypothetical protein
MRDVVIAVVGDVHSNSTVALCPPEGFVDDDGLTRRPSKVQSWLWACWENYWTAVASLRKDRELYVVVNGETVEGFHHGSTQVMSANPSDQFKVARKVFQVPQLLKPEHWFIVRGTPAHAGKAGSSDEGMARWLEAEKEPGTDNHSWWHLHIEANGTTFDIKHHGRRGYRPWTQGNAVNMLAAEITMQYAQRQQPFPTYALRHHIHLCRDSYDNFPLRCITGPCWQASTVYTHRFESMADYGGMIFLCKSDGSSEVIKKLYEPEADPIWQSRSRKAS